MAAAACIRVLLNPCSMPSRQTRQKFGQFVLTFGISRTKSKLESNDKQFAMAKAV